MITFYISDDEHLYFSIEYGQSESECLEYREWVLHFHVECVILLPPELHHAPPYIDSFDPVLIRHDLEVLDTAFDNVPLLPLPLPVPFPPHPLVVAHLHAPFAVHPAHQGRFLRQRFALLHIRFPRIQVFHPRHNYLALPRDHPFPILFLPVRHCQMLVPHLMQGHPRVLGRVLPRVIEDVVRTGLGKAPQFTQGMGRRPGMLQFRLGDQEVGSLVQGTLLGEEQCVQFVRVRLHQVQSEHRVQKVQVVFVPGQFELKSASFHRDWSHQKLTRERIV